MSSTCLTPLKFTGQLRDDESKLDYFGARYMSAASGRFLGADAPFADQRTADPQSWNLYAYVANRPLGYVDPSGRATFPAEKWVNNLVLWTDPALRAVIRAAPNYSPREFERQLSSKHDDKLLGSAGEAMMLDNWTDKLNRNGSIATPQEGGADVMVRNSTGKFVLSGVVSGAADKTGSMTVRALGSGFAAEIKTLNPDNKPFLNAASLMKGASQVAGLASTGSWAVLVTDQKAWSNLNDQQRGQILGELQKSGNAVVVLVPDLYKNAQARADALRSWAVK